MFLPAENVHIKDFRAAYGLPDDFGITLFETKDFTGLGHIDKAGAQLRELREAILDSIPQSTPPRGWMTFILELQLLFFRKLREVNPVIGLKGEEIDFAASGFGDVCQTFTHACLRAQVEAKPLPDFWQVYMDWLNKTVMISRVPILYEHYGEQWKIQIVRNIYGRTGMIVNTGMEQYYVRDNTLGCPAEGFMASFLSEVGERIVATMKGG